MVSVIEATLSALTIKRNRLIIVFALFLQQLAQSHIASEGL